LRARVVILRILTKGFTICTTAAITIIISGSTDPVALIVGGVRTYCTSTKTAFSAWAKRSPNFLIR
jgi:hypothetical protein